MLVWLDQVDCQEETLVGGKAGKLSLLAANYPVPPGFCLTTEAYAKWALGQEINTVPRAAQDLLTTAYADLAKRCKMADPRVAVRSSAVGEDGQSASFAGQYDTYLNLVGAPAVIEAVGRCWASAQSERVLAYHRQQGRSTADIQLAVLVMQLVESDISIIAFSSNPVTHDRDGIVINASWGLGESVVSGTVTPDTYKVRKSDITITDRQIAEKQRMTVITLDGVKEVPIPRPMRRQRAMNDEQTVEVAQLALDLEHHMGWPVDIECAYQGGKLYLLQCRPVSTIHA
jgi:pyruvate,water dikinase